MKEFMPFFLEYYVKEIVKLMIEKLGYDEKKALGEFLDSETYKMLENYEMEMWQFGYEAIFELWECEKITGNVLNCSYISSN